MKEFKYYIGCGDPFGEDGPNEIFNYVYVEKLKNLGIKEEDMKEVAKMFEKIYDIGYNNGYSSSTFDSDESA